MSSVGREGWAAIRFVRWWVGGRDVGCLFTVLRVRESGKEKEKELCGLGVLGYFDLQGSGADVEGQWCGQLDGFAVHGGRDGGLAGADL